MLIILERPTSLFSFQTINWPMTMGEVDGRIDKSLCLFTCCFKFHQSKQAGMITYLDMTQDKDVPPSNQGKVTKATIMWSVLMVRSKLCKWFTWCSASFKVCCYLSNFLHLVPMIKKSFDKWPQQWPKILFPN